MKIKKDKQLSFHIGEIKNNTLKSNDFMVDKNIKYFIAGEIFEPESLGIYDIYTTLKEKKELPTLSGEFNLCIEDDEKIYILTDTLATIKWYYTYSKNHFLVSNNFWFVLDKLGHGVEALNRNAIYESLIMGQSLDNETIINDINIVPPASILEYDKISKNITINTYTDIIYTMDDTLTKEDIFNGLDELFEKTVEKIQYFNKNKTNIAITISGGLDSRFPLPYFTKKKTYNIFGYLIGKKNSFIEPIDIQSAKNLSKIFNIKFKVIDPFTTSIQKKVELDLLRKPEPSSDILKAVDKKEAFSENFDILITGSYGGMIGGRILNYNLLDVKDYKELAQKIFYEYSEWIQFGFLEKGYKQAYFVNNLKRIRNFFTNSSAKNYDHINDFLNFDFLIPAKKKQQVYQNLIYKIKNEKLQKQKNNLSIIMKIHLYRHSIRGSFESLHGQVKAYSIYHPYIFEFSKKWPVKFLQNRSLMEEFLYKKYKYLAEAPLQTFTLPLNYKFEKINVIKKIFKKIFTLSNYIIRRLAINYTTWWKNDNFQSFLKNTLEEETYFYEIFKKEDIQKVFQDNQYSRLKENIFKTKLLIDYIEKKEYQHLLKSDFDETTKY